MNTSISRPQSPQVIQTTSAKLSAHPSPQATHQKPLTQTTLNSFSQWINTLFKGYVAFLAVCSKGQISSGQNGARRLTRRNKPEYFFIHNPTYVDKSCKSGESGESGESVDGLDEAKGIEKN
jgi:hypothetical protein